MPADFFHQPYSPERRSAPLSPGGKTIRPVVGKIIAHIVQEQIGVWVDQLIGKFRKCRVDTGPEPADMATGATDP